MVYKFIPPIYCDLGDVLWHCFTHMIFMNNRFYKDISYLSMDIYYCFTHIRIFPAEQQHFFPTPGSGCALPQRPAAQRRSAGGGANWVGEIGHWKITLECGTLDVQFFLLRCFLGSSDLVGCFWINVCGCAVAAFLGCSRYAPFFPIPFGWWRPFPDTPITIISSCFSHEISIFPG